MTKIKNSFDSIQDLKGCNLKRLFKNQELQLKMVDCNIGINNNNAYMYLQNVLVINRVIQKKLDKIK